MASNMSETVDISNSRPELMPSNVMQPTRQNTNPRPNMNNSGNKQRFNNQEQQNRYALNKPEGRKSEKENNGNPEDPASRKDSFNGAGGSGNRGSKNGKYGYKNGTKDDREYKHSYNKQAADDRLLEKILSLSGPTLDLAPSINTERKFQNKCRLYIGNVSSEITEEEILELFKPFGESTELFLNKEKNFAFIRMDYKSNAEKAKNELDGQFFKGRAIKVRFAPINAAIRVKCLNSAVTNELLELAFSIFGEIERAVVLVDDRGNSKNEGIIEFTRKPAAVQALKRCQDGVFFLTQSLKPVIVEPLDLIDDEDGLSEKSINKKLSDYFKQRSIGPRFATIGSFEFEYGTRWKQLYEMYKQKEEALQKELKLEEEKLEAQMEFARYENETEILREQLRQREADRERQKQEWEMKERHAEEQRRCDEESMRRQTEEMHLRIQQQDDELRRRHQENSIFMQPLEVYLPLCTCT
uniref:Hrp65 protein n=1 Tax=Cacopsylla melanoneura TaxID=428564 RepID=A0A8D8REN1_9HEMI